MFIAEKNGVIGLDGKIVTNGLCSHLFIGIEALNQAYKELICMQFPKRNIFVLAQEKDYLVAKETLYKNLFSWVDGNLSEIKIAQNLFPLPILIKVDEATAEISIRDILSDEKFKRKDLCCTSDLLTTKIELEIQNLM